MFFGRIKLLSKYSVTSRVVSLSITIFFICLADALLSYWVPNYLNQIYKDESRVGIIIAFSSTTGLLADLIIPQLIRSISVRKLVFITICLLFIFSGLLIGATFKPVLIVILLAMATWGIYYDLLGFAQQQFVADATPLSYHTKAWGILGSIKSTSYFLGPIISSSLLLGNNSAPLYLSLVFIAISLILLTLTRKNHERQLLINSTKVNLLTEFNHWIVLAKRVWPVLIMSLFIGMVDSFFWTIGAIWSENLAKESFYGRMFLSAYVFPSLFVGLLLARMDIYKKKKRKAIILIFFSSVFLLLISVNQNVFWQLITVLISSIGLSAAYPLIDAVYSDLVERMGRAREHLIGLSDSTLNIAYIIGPIIAGTISSLFKEQYAFGALGLFGMLTSVVLYLLTPKKIKTPQNEIHGWE